LAGFVSLRAGLSLTVVHYVPGDGGKILRYKEEWFQCPILSASERVCSRGSDDQRGHGNHSYIVFII
jgi:hypothetical protein